MDNIGMPRNISIPQQHQRGSDCPALQVCRIVGNARNGCYAGYKSPTPVTSMSMDACIAGLILLTARGQGLFTQEMEDELQQRKIGFISSTEDLK